MTHNHLTLNDDDDDKRKISI